MESYSLDLRKRLVAGRRRGQSADELARLFGVSKRSVERFWKLQREQGTLEPKQRGGYRRSRLEGHDELLGQWICQQPDLSLEEMSERLAKQLNIRIGLTALWHRLEKLGLSYKKNAARRRARAA
jgi:transposase